MKISRMDVTEQELNGPHQTFTIATPVVTNTSRIEDSLDESSLLQSTNLGGAQFMDPLSNDKSPTDSSVPRRDGQATVAGNGVATSESNPAPTLEPSSAEDASTLQNGHTIDEEGRQSQTERDQNLTSSQKSAAPDEVVASAKKKKGVRKGAKLDTKSKLEKSRQSARECRARKKLRYQYLEDLVCNREKAVVKLREELSAFCEMARKIDGGSISGEERRLLIEQTKENSKA